MRIAYFTSRNKSSRHLPSLSSHYGYFNSSQEYIQALRTLKKCESAPHWFLLKVGVCITSAFILCNNDYVQLYNVNNVKLLWNFVCELKFICISSLYTWIRCLLLTVKSMQTGGVPDKLVQAMSRDSVDADHNSLSELDSVLSLTQELLPTSARDRCALAYIL